MFTTHDVSHIIVTALPELGKEVNYWPPDLYHLHVMELLVYTNLAIAAGDLKLLDRCYQVAYDLFVQGDNEVRNAIAVSFLEDLSFNNEHGSQAKAHLPNTLLIECARLDEYMTALVGQSWFYGKSKRNWFTKNELADAKGNANTHI